MSIQSATEFMNHVEANTSLQEKLEPINSPEELIRLARQEGYEFTTEEIKSVTSSAQPEELSEEQLDAVAGGGLIREVAGSTWRASKKVWKALW
jgi:predicted ribosomally synthesized peptide with nif11-like leader